MLDPLIYSKLKDFCITTIQGIITANQTVFAPDKWPVFRQMQKTETNVVYPCITVIEVRMNPETTGYMAGDTENYYWMLPFNVLIQARDAGSLSVVEPKYMAVHQCLMDNFRQALFLDSSDKPFVQAEVFPKPVFEPDDGRYQDVAGGMVLKFWAIESRS